MRKMVIVRAEQSSIPMGEVKMIIRNYCWIHKMRFGGEAVFWMGYECPKSPLRYAKEWFQVVGLRLTIPLIDIGLLVSYFGYILIACRTGASRG